MSAHDNCTCCRHTREPFELPSRLDYSDLRAVEYLKDPGLLDREHQTPIGLLPKSQT